MRAYSVLFGLVLAAAGLCGYVMAQVSPQSGGSSMAQAPRPGTPGPTDPLSRADPTMRTAEIPQRVDDKQFLKDATMGELTEIELGKLAAEKASSDTVKQFGQKMIDEHTKVSGEIREIASSHSISVPDALDAKHRSRVDKLAKLSAKEFDQAYLKDQLRDHENGIREFQREVQGGTDPNVKDFALKTLPDLQQHLAMVKNLQKAEKHPDLNRPKA